MGARRRLAQAVPALLAACATASDDTAFDTGKFDDCAPLGAAVDTDLWAYGINYNTLPHLEPIVVRDQAAYDAAWSAYDVAGPQPVLDFATAQVVLLGWENGGCVVEIVPRKFYSRADGEPGLVLSIEYVLDGEDCDAPQCDSGDTRTAVWTTPVGDVTACTYGNCGP